MAERRVFIQFNSKETVGPESLIAAIRRAYALLKELDSSVSQDPKGQIHWEIETIRKSSPLRFGFIGRSATPTSAVMPVIREITTGLRDLSKRTDRPGKYSDKLLQTVKELGELEKRKDLGTVSVFASPKDKRKVTVTGKVAKAIGEWLEPTDESYGSITGSLDSITVHRSNEFRVWDELSEKPVTCRFEPEFLSLIKKALKHRVLVNGLVRRNAQGIPVTISVKDIAMIEADSQLPDIHDMAGLVEDFTDGKSVSDYLEEIRGDH